MINFIIPQREEDFFSFIKQVDTNCNTENIQIIAAQIIYKEQKKYTSYIHIYSCEIMNYIDTNQVLLPKNQIHDLNMITNRFINNKPIEIKDNYIKKFNFKVKIISGSDIEYTDSTDRVIAKSVLINNSEHDIHILYGEKNIIKSLFKSHKILHVLNFEFSIEAIKNTNLDKLFYRTLNHNPNIKYYEVHGNSHSILINYNFFNYNSLIISKIKTKEKCIAVEVYEGLIEEDNDDYPDNLFISLEDFHKIIDTFEQKGANSDIIITLNGQQYELLIDQFQNPYDTTEEAKWISLHKKEHPEKEREDFIFFIL